jgi:RNA polymerase sigma-70 factor (ECF subfamily)
MHYFSYFSVDNKATALPESFPDNEPALLKSIAAGDTRAFSQVYHRYAGKTYATVMTYVKNEAEAEEIVQQVFVKIWERRSSLAGIRSFSDYLFILVRNSVFDYFNRLTRHARLADVVSRDAVGTEDEAERLLSQKQYDQLVEKAIRQLPERQREVYLLAERQCLGYDDIARAMQISRPTAKKHMELARKSLRAYISRHILLFFIVHYAAGVLHSSL